MAATQMCMLSTVDNPYNPFDEFDKWLVYDISKGHNCCGIVDRITTTSRDFSDAMQTSDISEAIERFVSADPFDLYIKVTK